MAAAVGVGGAAAGGGDVARAEREIELFGWGRYGGRETGGKKREAERESVVGVGEAVAEGDALDVVDRQEGKGERRAERLVDRTGRGLS
jgi:hypothetical protein